jgi:hypothetical protein
LTERQAKALSTALRLGYYTLSKESKDFFLSPNDRVAPDNLRGASEEGGGKSSPCATSLSRAPAQRSNNQKKLSKQARKKVVII